MKLIYQLGRLDLSFDRALLFSIDETFQCQTSLTGYALKSYFLSRHEACALQLIFPVSLLLQRALPQRRKDLTISHSIEKILQQPEEYLSNPIPYFSEHPHLTLADSFELIHSVGTYEGISFYATLDHLVLEIFLKMWKDTFGEGGFSEFPSHIQALEIYLDISGGHNIYNSALLEAGRFFLTLLKLMLIHEREGLPKVYIAFSEPISPDREGPYRIYRDYELKAMAFFSMPEKPAIRTIKNAFSSTLVKPIFQTFAIEDSSLKATINEVLSRAYLFYSALKNNTPLVLYQWEHDELSTLFGIINKLIEYIKEKLSQNYLHPPTLDLSLIRKFFSMISLYIGLINLFKQHGISKREAISLRELSENFAQEERSIYHLLGLSANIPYLRHELNRNFYKPRSRELKKFSSEFSPLKTYLESFQPEGAEASIQEIPRVDENLEARNFFAHCGFERNIVEVRGEAEEVFFRYADTYGDKKVARVIEEYLLST